MIDSLIEFTEDAADISGNIIAINSIPDSTANILQDFFDGYGRSIGDEVRRCFGTDEANSLVRKGSGNISNVMIRIPGFEGYDPVEHNFKINDADITFKTQIPACSQLNLRIRNENLPTIALKNLVEALRVRRDPGDKEDLNLHAFALLAVLGNFMHPLIAGPLADNAFYLPADRTGVMHAHNVVVSALIGSAAMTGVRPAARTPMLSGVLADFLEKLIELGRTTGARRKPHNDLGNSIEQTILRGAIEIERSEAVGYPHFIYRPKGWESNLSLTNASSMVSELAPVVLYLRHVVEQGNVLIIEEPESHLHPAMQAQLIREIAALVRAGVRVLVTTHSEWVLEELANIVGRSRLPESEQNDIPANKIALPASDVGVWLFEPKERPKGSVVREVALDESGLYATGFGEVAAALHNDWADISSRSQETG